jgi:hypothetical protein
MSSAKGDWHPLARFRHRREGLLVGAEVGVERRRVRETALCTELHRIAARPITRSTLNDVVQHQHHGGSSSCLHEFGFNENSDFVSF